MWAPAGEKGGHYFAIYLNAANSDPTSLKCRVVRGPHRCPKIPTLEFYYRKGCLSYYRQSYAIGMGASHVRVVQKEWTIFILELYSYCRMGDIRVGVLQ
jgi:hypothetical protein